MAFTLTIVKGDDAGKRYTLERPDIRVGRNPDNEVVLKDAGASRYHFRIIEDGESYILRDLKSANGTKLNSVNITEAQISDGDVISVGKAELRFSIRKAAKKRSADFSEQAESLKPRPAEPAEMPASAARPKPAARPVPLPTGRPRPAPRVAGAATGAANSEAAPQAEVEPEAQPNGMPMARAGAGVKVRDPQAAPLFAGAARSSPIQRDNAPQRRKRKRILFGGLAALILIFFGLGAAKKLLKKQVVGIADQSSTQFRLDAKGDERVFGLGSEIDVLCSDKATFVFNYGNGRVTLTYDVIGVEYRNEIEVKVNGIAVATAPLAIDKWVKGVQVDVPRKHLMQNSQNEFVFDNTKNPPEQQTWAISDVRVVEDPLPQPDIEKARQKFELGKKTYDAKDVSLGNRYRAWSYFKEARDYLELLEPKPDIYYEAVEAIERVQEELKQKYEQMMFDAQRALQYDKLDDAIEILKNIMLLYPAMEDPHFKEAQENIEALSE